MTQNKKYSISSILQHDRVVDNNCCVQLSNSEFPYYVFQIKQMEGSYHLLSYKD